jgi:hypothetical protein
LAREAVARLSAEWRIQAIDEERFGAEDRIRLMKDVHSRGAPN